MMHILVDEAYLLEKLSSCGGYTEAPIQICFRTSEAFRKVHHILFYVNVFTRMLPFGWKLLLVISADRQMIDSGSMSKFAMASMK